MKKLLSVLFAMALVFTLMPSAPIIVIEAEEKAGEYTLYPTPRNVEYGLETVELNDVNIVMSEFVDGPTKRRLEAVLKEKGIKYTISETVSITKVNIVLGVKGEDAAIQTIMDAHNFADISALDSLEGYVLSVKDNSVYLQGSETVALFYAVLTLEQMIKEDVKLKEVLINDYSDNVNRGTIEGFYGVPWSQQSRTDIINMLADQKMNQYYYAPKDDPYHFGPDWIVPYPEKELADMKTLVDVANEGHVDFIYTLHISNDMDLTDEDDAENATLEEILNQQWDIRGTDADRGKWIPKGQKAIDAYDADETWNHFITKFDQLYKIGVRRFGILADDIDFPVARYSIPYLVRFVNDMQTYLEETYDDVEPLIFVPSYYSQGDTNYNGRTYMKYIKDGYDQKISQGMDKRIEIMWTGNHVMANVNHANNEQFKAWTGQEPLIWWNYPVTDYVPTRILLGPNPGLNSNATNMSGIIANPMQQGAASMISLFGVADYAWNMKDFDTVNNWKDSFKYLFPEVAESLYLISQHSTTGYSGNITPTNPESVYLQPFLTAFKAAVEAKDDALILSSGAALKVEMVRLQEAIIDVKTNVVSQELLKDLNPWLDKLNSLTNITNAIVNAYSSDDANIIWNEYSVINAEFASWPSITVEQLNGGVVNADIGVAHFTPFVRSMTLQLESELNDKLLDGDRLTHINSVISNVNNIVTPDVTVDGLTRSIDDLEEVTLDPYHYVGIKLDGAYYSNALSFKATTKNNETLTLEYSLNGVEWFEVEEDQNVGLRYVRVINNTAKPVDVTLESLSVILTGPKELLVTKGTTTANLYQNNGPMNLVDGKFGTAYWSSDNQAATQFITLEYAETFELYDFALYESTSDFIRNGSIYSSEDGKDWTKVGTISSNFVVETVEGADYNVIRGYADGLKTKFIKIATESTANNWTKLHEFEVNKTVDEYTGTVHPFNVIVDGKPNNVIDNDIKTTFTTDSGEPYLELGLTEFNHASNLIVLQNAQNISNAQVIAVTTAGEVEIGTLDKAYNAIDLSSLRDVLSIKFVWVDNDIPVQIHEVFTVSNELSKQDLIAKLEKVESLLTNENIAQEQKDAARDALYLAQSVISNKDATKGVIDDAMAALNLAINFVDKAKLGEAIESAQGLVEKDYTTKTWKHLQDVLVEAIELFETEFTLQKDVDAMTKRLLDAIDKLEEVETPVDPVDPVDPIDPENPVKPTPPVEGGLPGTGVGSVLTSSLVVIALGSVLLGIGRKRKTTKV